MSNYRTQILNWAETPAANPLDVVNETTEVECGGAATAVVQMLAATALAGATLTFEGRIHATAPWVVLAAYPTNGAAKGTAIAVTPTLTGVPTNGWIVSCNGMEQFRVRLSAVTGGNCRVGIRLSEAPHG